MIGVIDLRPTRPPEMVEMRPVDRDVVALARWEIEQMKRGAHPKPAVSVETITLEGATLEPRDGE